MNSHNCRVGKIRPNTNKDLISKKSENGLIKLESYRKKSFGDFKNKLIS